MSDENGAKYVTWRDMGDKLDEMSLQIAQLAERQARTETMLRVFLGLLPIVTALIVAWGPEIARALT